MARDEFKRISDLYSLIVKRLVCRDFVFPQGGIARRTIELFVDSFSKRYGGGYSDERLVDFCVCQAHVYRDVSFLQRVWKPVHSFGAKAILRYCECATGKRFYEDEWLAESGLDRAKLCEMIADQSSHPLQRFVYMPSEEGTKLRFQNTQAGYLLCEASTLMWSPLSAACVGCNQSVMCRASTEKRFPELYRLRLLDAKGRE